MRCYRFFVECDGIVFNATPTLERQAIKAWRDWFQHRPVICPGPFDYPIAEQRTVRSDDNGKVIAFLDRALEKHGPSSVVFVCTLF